MCLELGVKKMKTEFVYSGNKTRCNIEIENKTLWIEFDFVVKQPENDDGILILLLPWFWRKGISPDLEISEKLSNNLKILQSHLLNLRCIENAIDFPKGKSQKLKLSDSSYLMPYSGGIDSCHGYEYLKREHRIQPDCFFVAGYDIRVEQEKECDIAHKRCKKLVEKLLYVRSNYQDCLPEPFYWNFNYVFLLAGISQILNSHYDHCFIATHGWGLEITPESDIQQLLINDRLHYLLSGSRQKIDVVGNLLSKVNKVEYVCGNKLIEENCRVCYCRGRSDNCCFCNKCVWSQLCFYVNLGRIPACFPVAANRRAIDMQLTETLKDNPIMGLSILKSIKRMMEEKKLSMPEVDYHLPRYEEWACSSQR